MSLFTSGTFTLSGGAISPWKIDCDSLTDGDWQTLAALVRVLAGPYSSVEGVPTGGLKLAAALKPFAGKTGPLLLCDDVLTTGGSMEKMKRELEMAEQAKFFPFMPSPIRGVVVFARGQCPLWVKAICQLPECLWLSPRHR